MWMMIEYLWIKMTTIKQTGNHIVERSQNPEQRNRLMKSYTERRKTPEAKSLHNRLHQATPSDISTGIRDCVFPN